MKKRIFALILTLCCLLALAVPAMAAYSPEEQLEILYETDELIRQYCLDSSRLDDPLGRALGEELTDEELLQRLTDDPQLYDTLMTRMLSAYDSHTMYIPAGVYGDAFYSTGDYVGFGITIQPDAEGVRVAALHPEGGAAEAGIRWNDVITHVNGIPLAGLTVAAASQVMTGEEDSVAQLTVLRGEETFTVSAQRKTLTTVSYFGTEVEENIFYMKLSAFTSDDGSYAMFQRDLKKLNARDCLILDLRDNPGGDMDLACKIISDLLPGKQSYFRTAVRNPLTDTLEYTYLTSDGGGKKLKAVYILVNENSASASEIVTASLTDAGVAVAIGEPTYGKARGQYHIVLEDDSAIVLTVIKLMSIKRGDYEEIGLEPDIVAHDVLLPTQYVIEIPTDVALAPYSCSDNGTALNRALVALGYLPAMPDKPYQVGDATLDALSRLRDDLGLTAAEIPDGASLPMLAAINLLLDYMGQGFALQDTCLYEAVAHCREILGR